MNQMDMALDTPVAGRPDQARAAVVTALVLTALFAFMPALPRITLFSSLNDYLAAHQTVETFATVVAGLSSAGRAPAPNLVSVEPACPRGQS